MAQESHKSPNAIPPRTSSYGLNGLGIPQKSALRPLAETDWISSGKSSAKKHRHSQSSPPAMSPTPLSPRNLDAATHEKGLPWSAEKEKMILGPYEYLAGHPGKDFRAQMITAFNRLLRVPEASLAVITKVVGMLHTASLLIDDVEDSSNLRRGVPVANNIYGVPQTINSANYVYFLALQELQKLRSRKVIDIYTEELINLHRGQGLDLYWRDNLSCPTEAEYLDMVGNKTGGLFRLAIKLMQAEGTSAIDCLPIVNTMGLLFQVRDDHLNLSTYSSTKGLCEDLTEGKFSFPVIHAIQSDPSNNVLINILRQKTENEEVKKYAVSYMEKMGSFEHSRKTVNGLKEQALVMLEELEKQARDETGEQDRGSGIKIIIENLKVPTVYSTRRSSIMMDA